MFSASTADGLGDGTDAPASVSKPLVNVSTPTRSDTSSPSWTSAFTLALPAGGLLTVDFTDVDAISNDFIGSVTVPGLAEAVRRGYFYVTPAPGPVTWVSSDIAPVP